MNNVDEVMQVISLGLIVAGFLLNTNRLLKAIELCKECLFILKDKALFKGKIINNLFYKRICFTMWKAYRIIGDNTSAIRYVQIHREGGERLKECQLGIYLADMFLYETNLCQSAPNQ